MDTATCIKVACGLLLLITYFQRTSPQNVVTLKKRQTEVARDFGNNRKDVDEEAFSLEFSGEDYNTLVNLLLDAKNEFVKLQVNPNNPSYNRDASLNDTNPENATVIEEPVADTDTEVQPPGNEPLLKSDVTDDIYFNPVTPDPGFASPISLPPNPLAQTETVRDRKAKTAKLIAKLAQGPSQVDDGAGGTDPATTQDGAELGVGQGAPDDVYKTGTNCITPPQYLPVPYPVAVDPSSSFLYQPQYLPYSRQDGYVYPQETYAPTYDYLAPVPVVPQGRTDCYPTPGSVVPQGRTDYYPAPGPVVPQGRTDYYPDPGSVVPQGRTDYYPAPGPVVPQGRTDYYPASGPVVPQGRAEDPLRSSQPDGSFTSGDCLSYFCSRTVCTEWACTSDPCTSGQCVAKRCDEWSCDSWSNASLTKVQDIDWVMTPEYT